jgi:hypothetical protein
MESDEDIFLKVNGFTYLNYDAWTGITTWFKTNEDGSTTVYSRSDNDALLEANKATFLDTKNRKHGDWMPLARIDDLTMQNTHLSEALKQSDRKYVAKVLNDPDMAKFKTSDLKV